MELTRARIRLHFGQFAFGPGKADMLAAIASEGSISAAGRHLGMSYKRAWSLVESMNTHYARPLVESARGGSNGGGAHLTPEGEAMLAAYRRFCDTVLTAGAAEIALLGRDLVAQPETKAEADAP